MAHVLDNPVWNALISGNKPLAHGSAQVKLFAADVSPFVGFAHVSLVAFDQLRSLVPAGQRLGIISPGALAVPAEWLVSGPMRVWQMVQVRPKRGRVAGTPPLRPLGLAHVPAMLALTRWTNPGPFFSNTLAFGHYEGVFDGEELVAMAGQRLHVGPYTEISAVCTHPEYLGRGYASQLLHSQAQRMRAAGNTPFLHVRTDNAKAVRVYEAQGFEVRKELSIYLISMRPL